MAPACQRQAVPAGSIAGFIAHDLQKSRYDTWAAIAQRCSLASRLTVIPMSLPRTIEQEHYDRTQHEIERLGQE